MKLRFSFTEGCLFVPTWSRNDSLIFTTSTGVTFMATRDGSLVTWYTTTDNTKFSGTEEELYHHIRSKNDGYDYVRVSFAEHGQLSYAQFITSQQRDLFLHAFFYLALIEDHGHTVSFERIDDANTALWYITSTVPYIKKTSVMPDDSEATIFYVRDGAKEWYLSFGRTTRDACWDTDSIDTIRIPRLKVKLRVHVGVGKPRLFLKVRNHEIPISSAHELAEWTGWNVQEVQHAYLP